MAEFDINGEIPFKEGWKHGRNLSLIELADRQDALEQVGLLTSRLIKGVPKSQRASVLLGTNYVIGVASSSYGDEYNEDPGESVWIGDNRFQVKRYRAHNHYEGMEDYNIVKDNYATELVVWDHENTPPLIQQVLINQVQDVLEKSHEIQKTDALLAREWLDETRRFLLEALASSSSETTSP